MVAASLQILGGQGVQACTLAERLRQDGCPVTFIPINPDFPRGLRGLRRVPLLRTLPIGRTWAGLMPFSPDGRPMIGPIPHRPRLYLIGGMGSSGFGEGPMAGKLLADWIHTSVPLAGLIEAAPARCVREAE